MEREKERARKTLWYAEQTIVFFFLRAQRFDDWKKKCCGNRHLQDASEFGVCGFGQFMNQCSLSPTNTLWLKWAARRHAGRKWIFALLEKKTSHSDSFDDDKLTWNCKESLHVFLLDEFGHYVKTRVVSTCVPYSRRLFGGRRLACTCFNHMALGMRTWERERFNRPTRALLYVGCKIMRTKSFQSMTHSEGQHVLWNFWAQPIILYIYITTNWILCFDMLLAMGNNKLSWRKSACRHQRWRTTLARPSVVLIVASENSEKTSSSKKIPT